MELFEKIVTERITDAMQLSAAEQARVASDPELAQLIAQNAEMLGVAAGSPPPPAMGQMLQRVKLAESIMPKPSRLNPLEQVFGSGWQLKSATALAVCALLVAGYFTLPGLLAGSGNEADRTPRVADSARVESLLAHSSVGTWLEYSAAEDLNELERALLLEKLQLTVDDNSEDMTEEPEVRLLADGSAFSVYVPQLASTDPRVERIDSSIRSGKLFSLQNRSNRLFVEDARPGGDVRLISYSGGEVAFPAGISDQQLVGILQDLAPHLPQAGLPQQPEEISRIVAESFADAGFDSHWIAEGPEVPATNNGNAQPGISERDIEAIENFEKLELRLGSRLENSLAMYELSDEQIEQYRRDLEHELQLHLLLPSNWNSMQRRELDDTVYRMLLMQCRAMGIDTVDIEREQIAVSVNDEDAASEQLPPDPRRLMVDIRQR